MKTILFPTDFSENAGNAMKYALEIALKLNAALVLLHVSPIPYDFASRVAETMEGMEEYSKNKLKEITDSIKKDSRYKDVQCRGIHKTGSVIDTILHTAEETNADLILMGTKGASGINRLLFGTNTAEVIRQSKIPVLAVPEKAEFKQFDKIVYAVDYREDDLRILNEIAKVATQLNVGISTIHVAAENTLHEQIMHRGLIDLLNEKFPDKFSSHQLLIEKSFFKGIEDYLSANAGALLALAHYKKPFIDSLLNKSITREMAYQIKSPLLIFNL